MRSPAINDALLRCLVCLVLAAAACSNDAKRANPTKQCPTVRLPRAGRKGLRRPVERAARLRQAPTLERTVV